MPETSFVRQPSASVRKALQHARQACLDAGRGVAMRQGVDIEFLHEAGVILRPHAIGVCRSDAKEAAGRRPGPSQFGHELVADIVECWGTEAFSTGDIVSLDPNVVLHRTSGFAELIALDAPAAALEAALYKLPQRQGRLARYVLAEPVACAEHCVRMALDGLPALPERVIVAGAGTMGVFIALGLQRRGMRVVLANRSEERLRFAESLGLHGIGLSRLDTVKPGADLIVLATTFVPRALLDAAMNMVADGGRITLFGGIEPGFGDYLGIDVQALRLAERRQHLVLADGCRVELAGSYGLQREDFLHALDLIGSGEISPALLEQMITGRHALHEVPALLRAMNGGQDLGKRLILPHGPPP